MGSDFYKSISSWLEQQKETSNLRELKPLTRQDNGRVMLGAGAGTVGPLLDFSSNDYLALSTHPGIIAASRKALEEFGAGSGAARLMSGNLEIHGKLEQKVAQLKDQQAALVFGSGYMANTGIIPALVGRNDVIFTDRLNHASIYDGCRLAGADLVRFHHNDLSHLEELLQKKRGLGSALIVVESVYSMDGDFCPLKDLVGLKKRYDCLLLVDEAHATGVFGNKGGGLVEQQGVSQEVDLVMGTFGKALGSYGAYVAASREMISYLINRARSFIYSTALPPAVIGASLAAVEIIQKEPELRLELHRKVELFKSTLKKHGVADNPGPSQIIPIEIGESAKALALAAELRKKGVFATAVRPPTVPQGTARLRFSVTRHLSDNDLVQTAGALYEALKSCSV